MSDLVYPCFDKFIGNNNNNESDNIKYLTNTIETFENKIKDLQNILGLMIVVSIILLETIIIMIQKHNFSKHP